MTTSHRSVVRDPASRYRLRRGLRRALTVVLGLVLAGSNQLVVPPRATAGLGDAPNLIMAGELAEPGVPVDHLVLIFDEMIDPTSIPAGDRFTITFEAEGSQPEGTTVQGAAVDAVDLVYAGFAVSEFAGQPDLTFLKLSLPFGVTVTSADSLSLDYTPGANPIRDLDLNETGHIPGFTNIGIVDPSDPSEPMRLLGGVVDSNHGADSIVLFFLLPIDPLSLPATTDFSVEIFDPATNQTQIVTPSDRSLFRSDLNIGMLDLKLPSDVTRGQQVFLDYTPNPSPGAGRIRSVATRAEAEAIVRAEVSVVLDSDGDGLANDVDTHPASVSEAFDDRASTLHTFGTIVDRGGLDLTVTSRTTGVRLAATDAGPGTAIVDTCANNFELHLTAGDIVDVTCGSITTKVISGVVEVVLGGGITLVSVPAGVTAKVTDTGDGTFGVQNLGGGAVTVTVDGVGGTIVPGQTASVATTRFVGFSAPVDNPDVVNVVNAGRAVPLKWRLLRADGTPVTNLASAAIRVTSRPCELGTTPDLLEETSAWASGLQNLGNGYYQLNWGSPKTYAQSCKTLHLDLGEGITHDAFFNFTK